MATEIDALPTSKSIGWTDALIARLAANSVGLGGRLSITAPANASALSSTGYSLTGSNASSMIDLAGTWNTTGTPTLIKANVTNTASNAASLLMDLQLGGTSQFAIRASDARMTLGASIWDVYIASSINGLRVSTNGLFIPSGRVVVGSANSIGFSSGVAGTASEDLFLYRDAANTLALRNGANAQTFNVYGTYTSGSVYERGAVYADSNGFNIAHQQLGATKRPVRILGHNLASAEAVSALEINQTWNTTGTPTLIKANVTNTASNASSLLMDLQIGGASKLKCDTSSIVYLNGATSGSIARREDIDMLMLQNATTAYGVIGIGSVGFNYGINIRSSASLAWTIDTPASSRDLILLRDAANTLALRNAANAQAFNIYNTYTSGSVYERGFIRWVSNVLEIGTEHVGASARATAILAASGNIVLGRASGTNANADVWLGYSGAIKWSNSSTNTGASALADHCSLARVDPGILGVRGSGGAGGAISLVEMTSPAAPATNGVYIFAEDNGSGKTRLMARFATGATQQLAIEP